MFKWEAATVLPDAPYAPSPAASASVPGAAPEYLGCARQGWRGGPGAGLSLGSRMYSLAFRALSSHPLVFQPAWLCETSAACHFCHLFPIITHWRCRGKKLPPQDVGCAPGMCTRRPPALGWLVDWYSNLSFGPLKSKHLHSWLEFQQQTLRDQLARPGCPSVFSPISSPATQHSLNGCPQNPGWNLS